MFLILSLQFLGLAAFANSYLNHIPEAVFSGMVLYMGVVALFGVQMVERFFLMFMAPGQHPDIPYLKNVSFCLNIDRRLFNTFVTGQAELETLESIIWNKSDRGLGNFMLEYLRSRYSSPDQFGYLGCLASYKHPFRRAGVQSHSGAQRCSESEMF